MEDNNPLYNLYPLLDKNITREMIQDFVLNSGESLMEEGLTEKQAYQKIKVFIRNLSEEITNSCITLKRKSPLSKIENVENDIFLKVEDLAKRLCITKQQVHNLINAGKIKSSKISERGTRITEKDFQEFLKSRKKR